MIDAFKLIDLLVRFTPPTALLLLCSFCSLSAQASSVVNDNWQPYEALNDAEKADIAPYCSGGFVVPPLQDRQDGTTAFQFDQAEAISSQQFKFLGNVSFQTKGLTGNADEVDYDANAPSTLSGSVVLNAPNVAFGGTEAIVDLQSLYAQISQAEFVLADRDIHGEAKALFRDTDEDYSAEKIRFTRCQPDDPAWQLRASRLQVNTDEQVARVWHPRLEVQDVPVLYLPYISFPLNDQPRTGLLIPTFGNGYFQDYYLNLAPNYDATLGANLVSNDALQNPTSTDAFSLYSRNSARFLTRHHAGEADLLFNLTDAVTGDISRWSVEHQQSGRLAKTVDYGFRTRWVSDRFIDVDLTPGSNALVETQQTELELATQLSNWTFKTVNNYSQPVDDTDRSFFTLSTLNTANRPGLSFSAFYELAEPFENRTPATSDYELLKQPELIINASPQFFAGWSTSAQIGYTEATRNLPDTEKQSLDSSNQDLATDISRTVGSTKLTKTWALPFADITPSAELLYRQFDLENSVNDDFANDDSDVLTWRYSTLVTASSTAVTSNGNSHQFSPTLFYVYSPFIEQTSPIIDSEEVSGFSLTSTNRFNGLDRIADMNRLSAGLNYAYQPVNTERNLWTAGVQKSVAFNQERIGLTSVEPVNENYSPEFSPWYLSAGWQPTTNWQLSANATLTQDASAFDAYKVSANYRPTEKVFASAEVEQTSDNLRVQGGSYFPFRQNMALMAYSEFESPDTTFANLRRERTLVGLDIDSCCWNIRFAVLETAAAVDEDGDAFFLENSTFAPYFEVTLKGIGAGAGTIESMLERLDFGYAGRLFNSQ